MSPQFLFDSFKCDNNSQFEQSSSDIRQHLHSWQLFEGLSKPFSSKILIFDIALCQCENNYMSAETLPLSHHTPQKTNNFIHAIMFVFAKRHNRHAAEQFSSINPRFDSHSPTDVQKAQSSCSFLHLPLTCSNSDRVNTSSSK